MLNGNVLYCGHFKGIINYSEPGGDKRGVKVYDATAGGVHLFIVDGAVNDLDNINPQELRGEFESLLYVNGVQKVANRPDRFSVVLD